MKKRLMTNPIAILCGVVALVIIGVIVYGAVPHVGFGERPKEDDSEVITQENNHNFETIGAYTYPENPSEELRFALRKDAEARGLPIIVGDIERITSDGWERLQMTVVFTENNDNLCIIDFALKHEEHLIDRSLLGHDSPSFTLAFKDPDNVKDMEMVLISVFRYLSPDLDLEEAQRLANNQDKTLGTDGYAQPVDIGGYQVQARHTNPHVLLNIQGFDARLGVTVRAITQLWGAGFDTGLFRELSADDFGLLTRESRNWDDTSGEPDYVYSDFIVNAVTDYQSYVHGFTWTVVTAKSLITGEEYNLRLDTVAFRNTYEFGVGQQYTLFINRNYVIGVRGGIMYAVQQSETTQLNSRGEVQPLDGFAHDHTIPWTRIEPEGDGVVYNVSFVLQSRAWGDIFAALEGHGIGDAQWPFTPPIRKDYTFIGWYDNMEWQGEPYSKDTPIYEDTRLYARWEYSGNGGTWPRAYHGSIQGLDGNDSVIHGQQMSIMVAGYNMDLQNPHDQRFRWQPIAWRLENGANGNFPETAPYEATFSPVSGKQVLFIIYREEIFDGIDWQQTGQTHEVPEKTFTAD